VWAPRQRVLASGDIVVHPVPYASACFPGEWIAVLERIKTFDFAHLVPGHGEVQTDRAYLDRLVAGLTEIRAQVGPLARRGLPLDSVRRQIDLERVREAFAGRDSWRRFLMDAVFTGDIVRNAWQEARGDSIVQGGGG
jgi:glyoxylase-like metal-dependent hydrolase (beta-lactamase superfamily II)